MDYKKGLFLACIGFVMLTLFANIGLSWTSGYNNRIVINVSTSAGNYFNFSLPIILNSSNWGNNACIETNCNDTALTDINNNPLYYYVENYTATSNSIIIAKLPFLNATEQQLYFYYNSTNATRSSYYNGSMAYDQFDDFNADILIDEWIEGNFALNGSAIISTSTNAGWDYVYWGSKSLFKPYIIETFLISTGTGAGYGTAGLLWGYNGTTGSLLGIGDLGMGRILYTSGSQVNGSGSAATSLPQKDRVLVNATASYLYRNDTFVSTDNHGSNDGASGGLAYYYQGDVAAWDWYRAREIIPQELLIFAIGELEIPPGADYLQITYYSPDNLNITTGCDSVNISIIPISSLPLLNCSIQFNSSENYTFDSPVNNTLLSLIYAFDNGSYNFSWNCYAGTRGVSEMFNNTQNYTLLIGCSAPAPAACTNCTLYFPITEGWTYTKCLNNGFLYKEKIYKLGCNDCNYSEVETCKYGCEGDKCNLSLETGRINLFYLIILLLIGILIIFMIARFSR